MAGIGGTVEIVEVNGFVFGGGVGKVYVDQQDALRVLKSGDSMSGALNMTVNPIEGISYLDFDLNDGFDHSEGRLHWDDEDKTLVLDLEGGTGVKLQLGQEVHLRATNKSGAAIPNGSVVYVDDALGSRPTITLARNSDPTAILTLGLTTHDIGDNLTGYVTLIGLVRDLNTSMFANKDLLYLSDTPGGLTNIKPDAPAISVFIGIVLFSNPEEGVIAIRPVVIPRLSHLSDVDSRGSETIEDVLKWDGTKWVPYSLNNKVDVSDQVRLVYDPITNESGFQTRILNKTGAVSKKGTLVSASMVDDRSIILQNNEFDTVGIIAEDGISDGSLVWVWKNGSICEVLVEDGETATRGYLALSGEDDGRARFVLVPSSNPVTAEHFKEIGHCYGDASPGTDVLVLCDIHFN